MESANIENVNLINGKDNVDHTEGLQQFKNLLQKIKGYKNEKDPNKKPKKILITTDADACLFCGNVTTCAGYIGIGVMSDMVYVYRNIFKLCEEAGIKCDFCFLTKLQPYQCNLFFKQQLSERLGKDKDGKPFIKPEDIKFAPFNGENESIDHESFNKKMFGRGNGYKDTEVLYFDNDLVSHKIKNFKKNLEEQKVNTLFPVNIIHTEDVQNWITEEKAREDIVEKKLGDDFDSNKKMQEEWTENGYTKKDYIVYNKQYCCFEQKTGNHGYDFNEDGLKVGELLTATQDVLFENKSKLKEEQNKWIEQNFETDKVLAKKLFNKYYKETNLLYNQTINNIKQYNTAEEAFYKVAKDTFKKINDDEEIKDILKQYKDEPKLDTSVSEKTANTQQQDTKRNDGCVEDEYKRAVKTPLSNAGAHTNSGAQTSEFSWWNPCTWFSCCKDVQKSLDTDRKAEINL